MPAEKSTQQNTAGLRGGSSASVAQIKMFTFTQGTTGELAGSSAAEAIAMPSITVSMVNFKARLSNAGKVYIGFGTGVTIPDGTTDVTTGFELGPGDETNYIPIDNLNRFGRICDNSGDDLTYIALI